VRAEPFFISSALRNSFLRGMGGSLPCAAS
jgi:hypothetical protein